MPLSGGGELLCNFHPISLSDIQTLSSAQLALIKGRTFTSLSQAGTAPDAGTPAPASERAPTEQAPEHTGHAEESPGAGSQAQPQPQQQPQPQVQAQPPEPSTGEDPTGAPAKRAEPKKTFDPDAEHHEEEEKHVASPRFTMKMYCQPLWITPTNVPKMQPHGDRYMFPKGPEHAPLGLPAVPFPKLLPTDRRVLAMPPPPIPAPPGSPSDLQSDEMRKEVIAEVPQPIPLEDPAQSNVIAAVFFPVREAWQHVPRTKWVYDFL